MSTKTGIEWTDATWNPIRGCSRVSEGCRHCYAESVAYRFSGPGQPYEGLVQVKEVAPVPGWAVVDERLPKWNGAIRFVEKHLLDPLKWKAPRRIFVNSMSDLFHENVTDEMLINIAEVMLLGYWHTFQILTKRPQHLHRLAEAVEVAMLRCKRFEDLGGIASRNHLAALDMRRRDKIPWTLPLPNVWLGVSVEDQKAADARIPLLLQTPAAKRFISAEPLLGPVDLNVWACGEFPFCRDGFTQGASMEPGYCGGCGGHQSDPIHVSPEPRLDWVICGGESGAGARPMHPDWARGLRDQCVAAGVPFFFKQWGEWAQVQYQGQDGPLLKISLPNERTFKPRDREIVFTIDGPGPAAKSVNMERVGKKAAGHLLDGVEWHQFPEVKG